MNNVAKRKLRFQYVLREVAKNAAAVVRGLREPQAINPPVARETKKYALN